MACCIGLLLVFLVPSTRQVSPQQDSNALPPAEVLVRVENALSSYEHVVLVADSRCRESAAEFMTSIELKQHDGRVLLSRKVLAERQGEDPWRQQVDRVVAEGGEVVHFQSKLDDSMNQVDGIHSG